MLNSKMKFKNKQEQNMQTGNMMSCQNILKTDRGQFPFTWSSGMMAIF